jgi:hypothetical protein
MTNFNPVQRVCCPFRAAAMLAALVIGHWTFVIPASAATPVAVLAVQPTRVADLVLLNGGFDAGLREGMICRVTRGTVEIAEVQLVEIRRHSSAALILSLAAKQAIRAGDGARIKILKT